MTSMASLPTEAPPPSPSSSSPSHSHKRKQRRHLKQSSSPVGERKKFHISHAHGFHHYSLNGCHPPSQLCASKNGVSSPFGALLCKPVRGLPGLGKERSRTITCQATSIPADRVPDMGKRQLMNLLLLGAVSLPTAGMMIPYASFFVPAGSGGAGGGTVAKDALGNDVIEAAW